MGMGLLGHIKELSIPDIYHYLRQRHEATCIATLLGIGISFRGTKIKVFTRIDVRIFGRKLQIEIPTRILRKQQTILLRRFKNLVHHYSFHRDFLISLGM